MRNSIVQVTNLGNGSRHRYGKSFLEDEETLCLFLGREYGEKFRIIIRTCVLKIVPKGLYLKRPIYRTYVPKKVP